MALLRPPPADHYQISRYSPLVVEYEVMMRFGKWDDILAQSEPPDYRLMGRAFHRYARGVALSALGRIEEARSELRAFDLAVTQVPESWSKGPATCKELLAIARCVLVGEIAYRERRYDDAFQALREGVELEDRLGYTEPPSWCQPVRHALGALLLGAGRAAEAERAYLEDLERNPGNGWALLGLERALAAQGRLEEAARQAEIRRHAWPRADVQPTSSCYCQPAVD